MARPCASLSIAISLLIFFYSGAPILFRYTFPLFDEPILMITQIGRQVPLRLRVTCNRCWERFWNSQFPALTVIGQGTYGKHKFVHSFPPPNLGNKTFTFRNTCARIRDLLGTRTAERQEKAEMNAQGRWFASSFSTRKGSGLTSRVEIGRLLKQRKASRGQHFQFSGVTMGNLLRLYEASQDAGQLQTSTSLPFTDPWPSNSCARRASLSGIRSAIIGLIFSSRSRLSNALPTLPRA